MALLRCAAKFDTLISLDCAPTPSTLAQSKERKGSNFANWQHCEQIMTWRNMGADEMANIDLIHPMTLKWDVNKDNKLTFDEFKEQP